MNTISITVEEAQLIKRTAWVNSQDREPSEKDVVYVSKAIRMLTYIATLDSIMYDLIAELESIGLYRQEIKRRVNQAHDMVREVHDCSHRMLRNISDLAGRQYNDAMEHECDTIGDCILLEAPERSYNIVLALCRLIERYNNEISPRYNFRPANKLSRIPSLLDVIKQKDYYIDDIIDRNYRR